MTDSPTIVVGSLNDDELKQSITSLVSHVNKATQDITKEFDKTIDGMKSKLDELGSHKVSFGGSSSGGTSRMVKEQNDLTKSIERTTDKVKELNLTLDEGAKAMGRKTGGGLISLQSDVDKSLTYIVDTNRNVDEQMSSILRKEQELIEAKRAEAQETLNIASAQQAIRRGVSSYDLGIIPNVGAGVSAQANSRRKIADDTQYLREQVAALLEVEEREIKVANTATSSYNELSRYLKQLQAAYSRLGTDRIAKGDGQDLINEIQRVKRAMQQLQSIQSRPVSLHAALGLSEKNLDDISYKIRQLQLYMQGLDTSNAKSSQEFQRAAMNVNLLKEKQNELLNKNSQLIKSNNQLFASNTALGRSWNYMKNRLAFYFTVGASTAFVKNLIDIRSQYELNERALGILINSAERGTQVFQELSQMALVSPYTLIELSNAAKQLTAYEIAAKNVVDTTRRLADMASAVGVPMERLTYALGQIKAYGYLNSRDNRMFANAGIPLVKQLSDYYTELEGHLVSTADVYDRIKKKAVSFEDTMNVIYKMTDEGGRFFNFQEKMAGTLKVQLANLTLAWNNMLNDIGKSQQGILTTGIGALKDLFLAWKDIEGVLMNIAVAFGVVKGIQALATLAIGKQTVKTLEYVAANKMATWVEYKRALSLRGVNAEQAKWLIITDQSNKALIAALMRMGVLDKTLIRSLATMGGLRKGFTMLLLSGKMAINGLVAGFKSLGAAMMSNWPLLLLMAGVDLWQHFSRVNENNAEMVKSIAEGAKEASKALNDFITADDKVQARLDAQAHKLSQAQGEKMWEAIREQIELSALSAKSLIPELVGIPDINKRVTDAFDLAEKIQKATEALSGLEDELEVSQDSWLWGAFGEGLEEDIEDFVESFRNYKKEAEANNVSMSGAIFGEGDFRQNLNEAKNEIERFATDASEVIKERLGAEGIADPVQVNEAVERLIKGVEAKYPRIRGIGKRLFEGIVSDVMGRTFEVYDKQEQYYKMFLEQLSKDYGSRFRGVTDTILDETHRWNSGQMEAIQKTANEIKEAMPKASQDAIDDILAQLNSTDFKLRIITEFSSTTQNDVQKAFEKRFYDLNLVENLSQDEYEKKRLKNVQKYQAFMMKAGEDNVEYEKRIGEEREKNLNISKKNQEIISKGGDAAVVAEAKAQKEAADAWLTNMREVEKWGGYNFTKDKKGGSKKDPLLDSLKEEIKLVEKLQSDYDKLAKSGASQSDALSTIRNSYGKTIALLNAKLGTFGLPKIDIVKLITGKDPHMALEHFKATLESLVKRGLLTLERSKELEAVIDKLTISAKTYDLDKITKGLNNELGKLKDEYELALELDANPELGDMFTDMMNINVDKLPQTFGEAFDKANNIIKQELSKLTTEADGFDLMGTVIKADESGKFLGLDFNSQPVQDLIKIQKTWQDMFKKNLLDSEKMLDDYVKKYGDYSDKIAEIEADRLEKIKKLNNAYYTEEMRKRPEYIAKRNAIEEGARKEKKTAEFEDFKNSRYYTMMFENLDHISTKTLYDIKARLRDLIDSMNDLKPEQLKTVMQQYEKIEQKLIKRRPFKTLAKDLKEYFNVAKTHGNANKEFRDAQKAYDKQKEKVAAMKENFEQLKSSNILNKDGLNLKAEEINKEQNILELLKKQVEEAEKKAEKYNLVKKIAEEEAINLAQLIANNLAALGELRDTLQETFSFEFKNEINGAIDGLTKVGNGINQVISAAKSGNVVGTATGVVNTIAGIGDSIASIFGDGAARTKRINREINDSVEAVRLLNIAYKELEQSVRKALGTEETEAKRDIIANKEAQLIELERQEALERSKRSKDRDDDAVKQYQESAHDLRLEIEELKREVVDGLFGEDVKSAAESFVDTWVNAWKAGEITLEAISDKMDDMILHLVKKAMTSKIVEELLSPMYKELDNMTKEDSEGGVALTTNELRTLASQAGVTAREINTALGEFYGNLSSLGIVSQDDGDKKLSNLQQGIAGITEDTAGALEAITNGISQQSYLQSELLTQIRDAVVMFDADAQLGTFGQMLLQLQQSYQTQMAIQSILEGVLTPSGRAFNVELQS